MGQQMPSANNRKEVNGDGAATKSLLSRFTSSSIVILLLISFCHSSASIECYHSNSPTNNVTDTVKHSHVDDDGSNWCTVVYAIEDITGKWTFKYALTGDKLYSGQTCVGATNQHCALRTTTSSVNYTCCCNTARCNDPTINSAMNPRVQYEKQLKANGSQACFVRYDQSAIQDCTRTTKENEATTSPSRCLSVRSANSGQQELGCAHDGTIDRCDWTKDKNGRCRLNPMNNDLECCCLGAYCNGDAYMDLICRYTYANTSGLEYGGGSCATPNPTSTPFYPTTTNNEEFALWKILAVVVAAGCCVAILVGIFGCIIIIKRCKNKKRAEKKRLREEAAQLGTVTAKTSIMTRKRTESEIEMDKLQPKEVFSPNEGVDDLIKKGPQRNDQSRTMAGIESDFESRHRSQRDDGYDQY